MEDINLIISKAIQNPKFCDKYIDMFEDDARTRETYFYGKVDEHIFCVFLNKCKFCRKRQRLLSAIVASLLTEEISPKVFTKLIRIKGKYHESILIGLAHCNLSFYQLLALNKFRIDEALIKLLHYYFEHDLFTEYDLKILLAPWHQNIPQYIIEEFNEDDQQEIKRYVAGRF